MRWLDGLERLDRRWIFGVMGLLVLGPLLKPLYLPLTVTEHVRGFAAAIELLERGEQAGQVHASLPRPGTSARCRG